ncbi:MAG: amidophosphoribosyltransferase [Chitinophagales bacterium]|nr:amidophosphoribosyltransferase [Chitinophagales bacterium]
MSDSIKHECGLAFIRLLKPQQYYIDKYKTASYALNKMYLLMEKQHNRGQDGAGLAYIKLDTVPGDSYINRLRSIKQQPIQDIFKKVFNEFNNKTKTFKKGSVNAEWLKENVSSAGELFLGHLRYGTHGVNSVGACHPFIRKNNWRSRNLVMAGNFNLTNVDELIEFLVEIGQHPIEKRDTVTVMEKIGHFVDREVQRIFDKYKAGNYDNKTLSEFIEKEMDIAQILRLAAKDFDGGYLMAGLVGHGDAFILRDPNGIRPGYYYQDDEIVVVASERPAIQTSFNLSSDKIKEVPPGHALIIKKDGKISIEECLPAKQKLACSFERIYFSRGTDSEIYKERINLGYLLTERVMKEINYDYENAVFSFIPNTAEVAFYGLLKGVEEHINNHKQKVIESKSNLSSVELQHLLNLRPRVEKIAVKDVKMRTFITEDAARDEMVSHVYDITYDSIKRNTDTLVMIDDSIVRGTTLQKSILSILDRLGPKKIIIVSSAPQIRYPDCYGIDMSKMQDFIAFRALIELIRENKLEYKLDEVYKQCKEAILEKRSYERNFVQDLYALFTYGQISDKISEIVRPNHIFSEVKVVFQQVEDLHKACPSNLGDWYFTGNYPTPGGNRVVNKAFLNYMDGNNERAY